MKDWTWVVERRCPECGFDASSLVATDAAGVVRDNAAAWRALLERGAVRPGRPDPSTWSGLEYAAHVRDVYRLYLERLELMLAEDDPLFANWDQDAAAVADRYDEQDPAQVVADLEAAAVLLAERMERIGEGEWDRPGRRSDGAAFTVDRFLRYMAHDPVHHVWDVGRQAGA